MKRKVLICLLVCLFLVPSALGHGDKIRILDWNVYIRTDVFAVVQELIPLEEAVNQIIESDIIARSEIIRKHIEWLHLLPGS
ncbi:MAG: hypothetical protein JSV31_26335 [Desulfobacterales bacterium]|nr:MAG: hypothetical protein JSV31_26335 [Desulfobacterales bacterium]